MGAAAEPDAARLRGHDFEARITVPGPVDHDGYGTAGEGLVGGTVELAFSSGAVDWRATADVTFRADDLRSFRRDLDALDATLTGEAVLRSSDDMVELRIELANGKGLISGALHEHGLARLAFEHIQTDQSYLLDLVAAMERIAESLPSGL